MTGGLSAWREVCSRCGLGWALDERRWACRCGGLLDLVGPLADPIGGAGSLGAERSGRGAGSLGAERRGRGAGSLGAGRSEVRGPSVSPLVRHGAALPPGSGSVDLGSVVTPAVELAPGIWVKADYEHPTGSFKDRGSSVMIGVAQRLGIDSVVVDSSGNAGKSVAAHASQAGMACAVYLPAGTAPDKVEAMAGYGAEIVLVPGGRQAAAEAAQRAVAQHAAAQGAAGQGAAGQGAAGAAGPWYASHVYQPLFHHGVKTLAFELYEQVEGLAAGSVFVPAGNGTLVLGLWLGFGELVAVGRMPRRPAIVAVQAEACAPLAGTGAAGMAISTAAVGIAIPAPARASQIRAAVIASGGRVMAVGEDEIRVARAELSEGGFEAEPTGAVAWAGLRAWRTGPGPEGGGAGSGPAVAVLTGR